MWKDCTKEENVSTDSCTGKIKQTSRICPLVHPIHPPTTTFLVCVEGLCKMGISFHGFLHRQNQTNKPHLPTCPPNSPPYYYDCYLLRIYQKSGGFPKEPFSGVLFHSTLEVSFKRAISGVLKRRNRTGKGPDAPRPRQIYCRKSPCLESPAILLCSGNHPARGRSLSCT